MPTSSRKTILLATDQQQSVLNASHATQNHPLAYSPYGHRPPGNGLLSLLGFNGELPDPVTGHYHLGKGYRQFNPVLMRFNSPDSWSPFGDGGINAYAYCKGEPVLGSDPTGHVPKWLNKLVNLFLSKPNKHTKVQAAASKNSNIVQQPRSERLPSILERYAKGNPEYEQMAFKGLDDFLMGSLTHTQKKKANLFFFKENLRPKTKHLSR
jgi:RHS repeat-associated protein